MQDANCEGVEYQWGISAGAMTACIIFAFVNVILTLTQAALFFNEFKNEDFKSISFWSFWKLLDVFYIILNCVLSVLQLTVGFSEELRNSKEAKTDLPMKDIKELIRSSALKDTRITAMWVLMAMSFKLMYYLKLIYIIDKYV